VGCPRKFKSKIKSKFKNPKSTAPLNEKSVEWATCESKFKFKIKVKRPTSAKGGQIWGTRAPVHQWEIWGTGG
jgi:hypothetical protein